MSQSIPFYKHDLGEAELAAISEVFRGPILTTGDTVARFEREFAALLGRKHALAVTSCTGGLHMSLLALGIGPGDEVITTPMTFIATATAIMESGATPVFVDVESTTGNLDAKLLEEAITPRTKAIMPVHLYGCMCDMRAIRRVAEAHSLHVVEDAAHCVEGERDGVKPGGLAATACFSFYATKNLACGEGGAIVTDDDALFEKLRLLRLHGMTKTAADRQREGYVHWDMVSLGWKYNLDNIHAAILLPQMRRLGQKLTLRHSLAETYESHLADVAGVQTFRVPEETIHARHLFPIRVPAQVRDQLVAELTAAGVGTVVNYRSIHLLKYFSETLRYEEGSFPQAERIGNEVLSLPFYPGMTSEEVEFVTHHVGAILAQKL